MERQKLGGLVSIRSGYSFRKKVINDESGKVSIIQMRDLISGYTDIIKKEELFKISISSLKEGHILNKGDIL